MVDFYALDAIIAVGYRVNSLGATRFRQWATATLKEYITKGFVLNDDMLKNGRPFGKDYFDELLARIRDIRASERRVWLKITDNSSTETVCRSSLLMLTNRQNSLTALQYADRT